MFDSPRSGKQDDMDVRSSDLESPRLSLDLRRMRVADLAQVMTIERHSFSSPWPLQAFAQVMADATAEGLVAYQRDEVIGYIVSVLRRKEVLIANLAVRADLRRTGVATALIKGSLSWAEVRGAEYAILDVRESNVSAIRLYRRLGFRVIGKRSGYYSQPSEDSLVMRLEISSPGAGSKKASPLG